MMSDLHVDQLIFDEKEMIAYYGTNCGKLKLGSYDNGEYYGILGVFATLRNVKYNSETFYEKLLGANTINLK